MIDWTSAQRRLAERGYYALDIDGRPGRGTYAGVFGFAAGRKPDATLLAIGAAATKVLPAHKIDATAERLGEFVAQTCNETGGFRVFEENLKYSVSAIRKAWPHRFPTDAAAQPFAWDPRDTDREDMALAARVYGQRMGNLPRHLDDDNEEDGWQFRGRGMLQLTGRANYAEFGRLAGLPLVQHPELAADPADSLKIAAIFWTRGKVNAAIDRGDFREARRITNGGAIGLEHVAELRSRILTILH
ncbi:glycoside hydrolase family 19 protein [Rhizorhabdus sp.]|uniref:glycoside hydrolase family 19 protein n=1 Tax=Rhizorhabdus sp. TaxID=1968843 RepID=UPI0035AF1EE9